MKQEDATRLVASLFDEWAPFLLRYGVRMTRSFEIADDLVQEVFLALYIALLKGKRIDNLKAWTFGALRNQVLKHAQYLERRAEDLEPSEELDLIAAQPCWPDVAAGFDEGAPLDLSVLSVREEEALLLRMQSFKYREIASQLGISTKSVCTLLARALKKLQIASRHPELARRRRSAWEVS
ncbi:MAG TPA: sigma-70 family RNA polymerase sigma factor [Bryobacteraceae bacterium]|nr:sigma-70 family RNA polymerase sigma factor [Bryobacteraceae bacterium]HPQ15262.1 sigma-70 family RNA polymerase sigma factor [Bryobacteraceae bacterium]